MAELDFSDLIEKPAPTVEMAVGAGAYRTAHIVTEVIPPPPLPRWYRAGAFILRTAIGEQRAATRQWYRRATGGRWSQVLNTDGDATWTPRSRRAVKSSHPTSIRIHDEHPRPLWPK